MVPDRLTEHHEFPGQVKLLAELRDAAVAKIVLASYVAGPVPARQIERDLAVASG
jgi:hypothetical protein